MIHNETDDVFSSLFMKLILRIAFSIGISFAVLALMLHLFAGGLNPENRPGILAVLQATTFSALGIYFVLYLVQLFVRALRYKILIAAAGEKTLPSMWHMALVTGVRNMFVDMLPARVGELTYVAMLNRGYKVGVDACLSSLTVAVAFDFVALLAVIVGLFANQLWVGSLEGWMLGVMVMALLVSVIALLSLFVIAPAVVAWLDANQDWRWQHSRFIRPLVGLARNVSTALVATRQSGVLLQVLLLSIAVRLLKYGGFFLLFKAVVVPSFQALAELPLVQVMGALIAGEVAASLPVPAFMSFGVYEAGGTAALTAFGLDKGDSLVAMLAVHIWSQLFDYVFGGLCLLLFVWLYRAVRQGGEMQKPMVRWLRYGVAIVVLAFGTVLLAKEYRATKKLGAVAAPPIGVDVSNDFVERLAATAQELQGVNGFVVWSSNRFGNHDIVRMDLPTREITQVTNHSHAEFYPRISPDGKRIAFSRAQQEWVSQRNWVAWDLYVKDLESGKETKIAVNANFANWVDDKTITYSQDGSSLIKKRLDGGDEEIVYQSGKQNAVPAGALISTPDYNPNTGQVVLTAKQAELGMNKGFWGTAVFQPDHSHDGLYDGCQIFFSSDGSYLYQVGKGGRFDKNGNQFLRIDPETYATSTLIDLDDRYSHIYFPKDSNDGSYLVFAGSAGDHEHDTADYELFLWKVGSNPNYATRLTFHSGNDNWPDVFISYYSD